MLRRLWLALAAIPFLAAGPALAEDDPSFLSVGAGWWDIIAQDDNQGDFRLEYRHGQRFLHIFKPWAGLEVTSAGGVWGGGGLLVDIYLGRRVVLTGSTGVGGFYKGDGKDLGHEIEFRSTIELGYRFDDRSRLSLAFGHLSNAGIGDDNPGTEVLTLYYHLPIDRLFGE
jgi:hypothetical protein